MRVPTPRAELIEDGLNDMYRLTGNLQRTLDEFDPVMADAACEMSMYGVSHRYFFVGGAAVVFAINKWAQELSFTELMNSRRPVGDLRFLTGANCSEKKGDPRSCPELTFAEWSDEIFDQYGRAYIMHIYTRGPSDPEEIKTCTGVRLDTLTFCYTCGPTMCKCKASWPDMPITTQSLDLSRDYYIREEHTLRSMIANADLWRRSSPPPLSSLDEKNSPSGQGNLVMVPRLVAAGQFAGQLIPYSLN